MYTQQPGFTPPGNPEAVIWRYLDFARLLSLLTSRSLYFARADLLGDSFEGTITKATVSSYADPRSMTSLPGFQDMLRKLRESLRRNVAVSCWHLAERESAGMWTQYAARGSGIALRSTFRRLVHALRNWPTPTYIGVVQYVDYDDESAVMGGNNLLLPFVHKRTEFDSERELRAVISQAPATQKDGAPVLDYSAALPPGTLATIDVSELVEHIVMAPQTPDWQLEALKHVLASLGVRIPLVRSKLDGSVVLG